MMLTIDRILLPTDFSENSAQATSYACALAEQFGSELHLLHVVEDFAATVPEASLLATEMEDYLEQAELRAAERLAKVLDPTWVEGKRVTLATKSGSPFVQIVVYAKEHQIDLIVMGTHGRSGLSHLLIGSVAERVVRKAPCPVLTVRPEGQQFIMP